MDNEVGMDTVAGLACINWLIDHAVLENNCYVWKNVNNDEYSQTSSDKEWISSYTQATIVDAFLSYYKISRDKIYLEWAENAAEIFDTEVKDGGLLTKSENLFWFETIACNTGQWDLIGHLRALVALGHLLEFTDDQRYQELFDNAELSLEEIASLYDTDYCLRDNLRVKDQVDFRFFNEYGDENHTEILEYIILRDPLSKTEILVEDIDSDGEFEYSFPSSELDPFRTEWMELVVHYEDTIEQHMTLEKESLVDDEDWVPVKDGELLLTGKGEEREWIIPIRMNDLGYTVSFELMSQYPKYFAELSKKNSNLIWLKNKSLAYYNMNKDTMVYRIVKNEKKELPIQTPFTTICSFDENGVLRQHGVVMGITEFDEKGNYLPPSIVGEPSYSPFVIFNQAVYGRKYWDNVLPPDIANFTENVSFWNSYNFLTIDNIGEIKQEPAYDWIVNNANQRNGFATWSYDTYNCYNDLEQETGWVSAYGQSLLLEALMKDPDQYSELIKEGAYAYGVPVEEGGLAAYDCTGNVWFEEVPNKSHIFNADILSINTLANIYSELDDKAIAALANSGINSLRGNIWRFDTGYWSKYDMNPKKENLFQIEWIEGDESPLIDEILIYDPVSGIASQIDVGEAMDSTGYPCISGLEWGAPLEVDGVSVRSFDNGYLKEYQPSSNITEQNVYFWGVLPPIMSDDYFDLLGYKLIIRYKDVAKGVFEIKRQSICEGMNLEFEQLPNARIVCTGDGEWKEAEILLRMQDLGWFMGEDYQRFHVEQLEKLSQITGDWLFEQYAEKWNYYLERQD